MKLFSENTNYNFVIENDDPEIGFYLYVYKNDKCIADYLQDSLENIKTLALDEFSIPIESWHIKK